jgi:type I restriction-modification system DNA methylase subunit
MSAISISNSVDLAQRDRREARYMEIVGRYDKEEASRFPQMFSELVMELEIALTDVLGEVFMEMDLGSKWHGQFFTPYSVCKMMASLQVDDHMKELVEARGFIRANEPACGGGAMMIALAESMQTAGINYQQHLHVVAQDLDLKAVCMAYVQLSLLHIPAVVIHGNSLELEELSRWYTPAHIMGAWEFRLRHETSAKEELPKTARATVEQFSLFEELTA